MASTPRATATIAGLPLHAMLAPIPLTCFLGTFFTDLAYSVSANMQWANMSAWLLTVGLLVAVLAVITGLIDFFGDRGMRNLRAVWIYGLSYGAVLLLSLFNIFIHSRDAYTSVVPTGLILSALAAIMLLVTVWTGVALVFRHGVGVENRA